MSQPKPTPNNNQPIADLVKLDIDERVKKGLAEYGTKLQHNNGRDFLLDAYEEILDLAKYLKGELLDRHGDYPDW